MKIFETIIKALVGLAIIVFCLAGAFYFWMSAQAQRWQYHEFHPRGEMRIDTLTGKVEVWSLNTKEWGDSFSLSTGSVTGSTATTDPMIDAFDRFLQQGATNKKGGAK